MLALIANLPSIVEVKGHSWVRALFCCVYGRGFDIWVGIESHNKSSSSGMNAASQVDATADKLLLLHEFCGHVYQPQRKNSSLLMNLCQHCVRCSCQCVDSDLAITFSYLQTQLSGLLPPISSSQMMEIKRDKFTPKLRNVDIVWSPVCRLNVGWSVVVHETSLEL